MKLGPMKPTGLCCVCGKPTQDFVHQECGKNAVTKRKRPARKTRKYSPGFIDTMVCIDK